MAVSEYKEIHLCRLEIDNALNKRLKQISSFSQSLFVREILLKFAVSESMVENFIYKYYVETGDVLLVDGELKSTKQVKK